MPTRAIDEPPRSEDVSAPAPRYSADEWDKTLMLALKQMTPAERLRHHILALRRLRRFQAAWRRSRKQRS